MGLRTRVPWAAPPACSLAPSTKGLRFEVEGGGGGGRILEEARLPRQQWLRHGDPQRPRAPHHFGYFRRLSASAPPMPRLALCACAATAAVPAPSCSALGFGFGFFRLSSGISACPGFSRSLPGKLACRRQEAVLPPSLSGADAGCISLWRAISIWICEDRGGGGSNKVLAPEVTDRGMVITEGHSLGGEARGVAKRMQGRAPSCLFANQTTCSQRFWLR